MSLVNQSCSNLLYVGRLPLILIWKTTVCMLISGFYDHFDIFYLQEEKKNPKRGI